MEPATTEVWDDVLATDPYALPTQTPAWIDALCRSGPYRSDAWQFRHESGRRLIVPMVRRKGVPRRVASRYALPDRWGVGGLVAEDGHRDRADIRAVMGMLAEWAMGPLVMVPNPRFDDRWSDAAPWSYASPKWNYDLDTGPGYEHVWNNSFRSSVRRAVRKAERSEVTVERDTTGRLLPLFHQLYEQSVLRWAADSGVPTPIARWRASRLESLEKFTHVAEAFGDACTTWMAFVGGQPAAGIIVLTHGFHADYWRGAMDLSLAGPVRANDLLHARAIEEACRSGLARYSFGISDPGSNLARFKEGFGATSLPYHGYVLERVPVRRFTRAARRQVRRGVVATAAATRHR